MKGLSFVPSAFAAKQTETFVFRLIRIGALIN